MTPPSAQGLLEAPRTPVAGATGRTDSARAPRPAGPAVRTVRIRGGASRVALLGLLLAFGLAALALSFGAPPEIRRQLLVSLAVVLLALGARLAGGPSQPSSRNPS
jgi:hypothetical protein